MSKKNYYKGSTFTVQENSNVLLIILMAGHCLISFIKNNFILDMKNKLRCKHYDLFSNLSGYSMQSSTNGSCKHYDLFSNLNRYSMQSSTSGIKFLAKYKREFTTKFAISPNGCLWQFFSSSCLSDFR